MTGVYSTVMGVGGALGAGVSIPLAQEANRGWRGSLVFWAFPAALAAITWLLLWRFRPRRMVARTVGVPTRRLWQSPLAWQVTLFMGLQSMAFYVAVAWFPAIFQNEGLSAATAGWMLSLLQLFGVVGSFLTPLIVERLRSQRVLIAAVILMSLVAYVGLLIGTITLIPLWCVLLGLGQGAYLSLALLFFILRTQDTRTAFELSGMAQSIGYLLAALGPLMIGWLHDLTHSWTLPLVVMILVMLALFGTGMGAGRNSTV